MNMSLQERYKYVIPNFKEILKSLIACSLLFYLKFILAFFSTYTESHDIIASYSNATIYFLFKLY